MLGEAVWATHTVTFAYPKIGMLLFPGAERVGKRHLVDIGFDWFQLNVKTPYKISTPTPDVYGNLGLARRSPESNKGDYGHVAVVAGSRGMAGAPALVARAAQRVGAGLVTVLAPACVQSTLAIKLDEQMTLPLADIDGSLSEAAFETIAAFAEKASVLCVGPGLTTAPRTVALVQRIITELEKPLILDADGLNALALNPDCIAKRSVHPYAPLIITPHPGEAARLLGTSIAEVQSNRIKAVTDLATRFHAIAVLKGRHTLVADTNGDILINTTGNPGMATGGMGDTLTGILGALLASFVVFGQKRSAPRLPFPARSVIALGVYLHGFAGDLVAQEKGEAGLVAGDLIERLPRAIQMLEEKR